MLFLPRSAVLPVTWLCIALGGITSFALSPQDDSSSHSAAIAVAKQKLDTGDFYGAASALSQMIQADSHSGADVYRLLAFAQFKQNNSQDALATCESGLVIYPKSGPLAELYVSILRKVFSTEDRRQRLETAIKWAPDSPSLAKALGEDLLTANPQDTRAMQLLSHAAELAPRDAEAHFFYGESLCFNQSGSACIEELRRAHELDPTNQQANMQLYTMIAVSEDELGQSKQAEKDFSLATRANRLLLHPSPYSALKYVTFLISQGERDQAMALLDEVLRWDPSYGPAHFERAKYLSAQGKKQEAIGEAELALQYPRSSMDELRSYHAFLAKIYFALGRRSDALIHQDWVESNSQHKPN